MKIVVLAGGVGTRLWPESRQRRPKQLLNLVGSRSMLQETVDRVPPLVTASDVYVVTGRPYAAAVAKQLPHVPRANVIGEPMGRGSAPAMGLAATYLADGEDDVLAFLPADHAISQPEPFRGEKNPETIRARVGQVQCLAQGLNVARLFRLSDPGRCRRCCPGQHDPFLVRESRLTLHGVGATVPGDGGACD